MTQKKLSYKGYQGTIEINTADYTLWGRILYIPVEVIYRGESFAELNENFQQAVEGYLSLLPG